MLAGQVETEQWAVEVNSSTLEPQIKFASQMAKYTTFPLSSYPIILYDPMVELGMHLDTVHSCIRYIAVPYGHIFIWLSSLLDCVSVRTKPVS